MNISIKDILGRISVENNGEYVESVVDNEMENRNEKIFHMKLSNNFCTVLNSHIIQYLDLGHIEYIKEAERFKFLVYVGSMGIKSIEDQCKITSHE